MCRSNISFGVRIVNIVFDCQLSTAGVLCTPLPDVTLNCLLWVPWHSGQGTGQVTTSTFHRKGIKIKRFESVNLICMFPSAIWSYWIYVEKWLLARMVHFFRQPGWPFPKIFYLWKARVHFHVCSAHLHHSVTCPLSSTFLSPNEVTQAHVLLPQECQSFCGWSLNTCRQARQWPKGTYFVKHWQSWLIAIMALYANMTILGLTMSDSNRLFCWCQELLVQPLQTCYLRLRLVSALLGHSFHISKVTADLWNHRKPLIFYIWGPLSTNLLAGGLGPSRLWRLSSTCQGLQGLFPVSNIERDTDKTVFISRTDAEMAVATMQRLGFSRRDNMKQELFNSSVRSSLHNHVPL